VTIAGNRGFVLFYNEESGNRIEILDLTPLPAPPVRLGMVPFPAQTYGGVGTIKVAGNYLYVATRHENSDPGGLRVIDISDPSRPFIAASVTLPDAGEMPFLGAALDVADTHAYVVTKSGLIVFDVTDPTNLVLTDRYSLPTAFTPSLGGNVVVRGPFAYVASFGDLSAGGFGGLAIYQTGLVGDVAARVDLSIGPEANDDTFTISQATFLLGDGSDGIAPPTDTVMLRLGTVSFTIPPGSFQPTSAGAFAFAGVIDGVTLEVTLTPLTRASFAFEASGVGANLTGIAVPVPVGLTIGEDTGSAMLPIAKVNAHRPPPQRENNPQER
jgi:hypothetical protein